MKIYQNIKISRKTLFSHKLRTFLALLGISIGITAVIVVVSIGEGAQDKIIKQIENMGSNLLIVHTEKNSSTSGSLRGRNNVTSLDLSDARTILTQCPFVESVAPAQEKTLKVKYANFSVITKILGTTADFISVRNFTLIRGRFFRSDENKAFLRVAVLGSHVRDNLFGNEDPINKIIRINNIPFKIIGVLKPKGSSPGGGNQDNQIVIPVNTALRRVFNLNYINSIYISVKNKEMMDLTEKQIRYLLREEHRLDQLEKADDFNIQNQKRIIQVEKDTRSSFTLLVAGIASISLFVGGIGILSIMFLSIKERINEIGLRIAVGAKPKDILVQFLSEAVILGLAGGFMGIILGIAGAYLLGITTNWHTKISPEPIILSVLFSFSVGLFFGTYPANKASHLDPIEALRAE